VVMTRQQGNQAVTVVIPAYNAADTLGETIDRIRHELAGLALPVEMLVVDDGSTDATPAVAASLPDVVVIRCPQNRGKGWAVYQGVRHASCPVVCFTDADAPFLPGSYRAVVERVLGGAPIAIGSRRLAGSEMLVRMDALSYAARRHLIGISFNRFLRWVTPLPLTDTQCGLKAFRRDVALQLFERIRSLRYLFDVEVLLAAQELGVPVEEVAVSVAYRDRKTSLRLVRESLVMGVGLLVIAWHARTGTYRNVNPRLAELEPAAAEPVTHRLPLMRQSRGAPHGP